MQLADFQLIPDLVFAVCRCLFRKGDIFLFQPGKRRPILFQIGFKVLHLGEPLVQHLGRFVPAFRGLMLSSVSCIFRACWVSTTACLNTLCGDVRPARLPRAFSALQVGICRRHKGVKIILPLGKADFVAQYILCRQAVVLCQGNESQVQMGREIDRMMEK